VRFQFSLVTHQNSDLLQIPCRGVEIAGTRWADQQSGSRLDPQAMITTGVGQLAE
jgi:hypothetical protein